MRSIFVGIEYAGKSTLIDLLDAYYQKRRRRTHLDDHFTIPDASLSPVSRAQYVHYPDDVKERMQRMQLHYHVEVIRNYPHTLIAGWHIEEAIYCDVYGNVAGNPYYPNYVHHNQRHYEVLVLEARLPDVVLIHLTADDEAIRERMRTDPHEYQIIDEKDIPDLKKRFEDEVDRSLLTRNGHLITLDTTEKSPEESLDELLLKTDPIVTDGELAMRAVAVPDGDYEVQYANGVRKMV